MIDYDLIVSRHDKREGYNIVDYQIVGIPIWRLELVTLAAIKSPISAAEEFLLKLIDAQVRGVEKISALLGLPIEVVNNAAVELTRSDALVIQNGAMELTKKGYEMLRTVSRSKSIERTYYVEYDAIVRKVVNLENYQLWTNSEIKDEAIRTLNAKPIRKPKVEELDIDQVENVVLPKKKDTNKSQIIRIKNVGSRRNLFQKALMIVFKSTTSDDIQVGFSIDGRLSNDHEIAFAKSDGIERYGIASSLRSQKEPIDNGVLKKDQAERLRSVADKNFDKYREISQRLSEVEASIKLVEEDKGSEYHDGSAESKGMQIDSLTQEKAVLKSDLVQHKIRWVHTYEHPGLLRDALETAQDRILIISPWITSAVVDDIFVSRISARLKRGVSVYIGYGLNERNDVKQSTTYAEKRLSTLSEQNSNFHMKNLGDTHAKILIKDDEFVITGSFNWLSFKGDPNKKFREEWGTYVGDKSLVDRQFDTFRKRIGP